MKEREREIDLKPPMAQGPLLSSQAHTSLRGSDKKPVLEEPAHLRAAMQSPCDGVPSVEMSLFLGKAL